MRLVTFSDGGDSRIGVLCDGDKVLDLSAAAPDLPPDMLGFIVLGDGALGVARDGVARAPKDALRPLSMVKLLAPIPRPARNILCVGKNYHEHAREFQASGFDRSSGGVDIPDAPIIFTKWTSSVIGPGAPIPSHLDPTASVDYEGELTIVIGKAGRRISRADAFGHIYGYTIINDVTARTIQRRHSQWFLGKSLDGFCPMGPCLVTADEIDDVGALELTTRVNGEVRQRASVADLIFDIPTLIETISLGMMLEPGDLIATGTPVGVGIGYDPPKFLQSGDEVAITIEPIGTLANPVV
jgi:2-keto-4-pentenoate hydratase/2-oxohepta-3-ene-1,7-dioic acid hydratase in catechol pathway